MTAFDGQTLKLSDGQVAIEGATAWIATVDSLTAHDTGTGTATEIPPGAGLVSGVTVGAPVVADITGTTAVLSVIPFSTPGTGTQVAKNGIRLLVADAHTCTLLWSADLPTPGFDDKSTLRIAGVDGGTAVIVNGRDIVAVDLVKHQPAWSKENMSKSVQVVAVGAGHVAVIEPNDFSEYQVNAFRVTDGTLDWTEAKEERLSAIPAGPGRIMVTRNKTARPVNALVDLATGRHISEIQRDLVPDRCIDDGKSVLVCTKESAGPLTAVGINSADGKVLWQLPTDERVAPYVTAVWHGTVYGRVDNVCLMLDAVTGEDRPGQLPDSPDLVDAHIGVFLGDRRHISGKYPEPVARRTTG
ncbi:PQQ-binding-like beta-propeller repeat protein [Kitasatospora purpeofusca]|uniref:outer membrane protein assembly factor BamB family protein n=1 Tax=Kitasatospora purpeofusca TaxID=67352 RepID=UPI0033EC643B